MFPQKLSEVYRQIRIALEAGGVHHSDRIARYLVKDAVSGVIDSDFITNPGREITVEQREKLECWTRRALDGEPVSKILGHTEFWGLPYKVTHDVLDPRPDSETVIEAALDFFGAGAPGRILDLGTGSGCLMISLLHEWPQAQGTGVDISEKALAIAQKNAVLNKVDTRAQFLLSDWDESIPNGESFDLIVANPPYIPSSEIPNLAKNVKNHDPILSLDGGKDGFFCHKKVLSVVKKRLNKHGICLLEIGYDQEKNVTRLVEESSLSVTNVHPDLAGIPRVVEISFGEK